MVGPSPHVRRLLALALLAGAGAHELYETSLIQSSVHLEHSESPWSHVNLEPADKPLSSLLEPLEQASAALDLASAAFITEDAEAREQIQAPELWPYLFQSSVGAPLGEADVRHPVWHFETFQLTHGMAYVCSVILMLAGILCAAGGIGGGGIYVTVLMVFGRLSVRDAVPLSKSIVWFGSLASLALNLMKSFEKAKPGQVKSASLIDYNICRLVVPSTLLGTFLGVFLNRRLPSWIILMVLVIVLVFISGQVMRDTYRQLEAERAAMAQADDALDQGGNPQMPLDEGKAQASSSTDEPVRTPSGEEAALEALKPLELKSRLGKLDFFLFVMTLFVVIVCGVFRAHSGECLNAVTAGPLSYSPADVEARCNHPIMFWLGHGTMEAWMSRPATAHAVRGIAIAIALAVTSLVTLHFCVVLYRKAGWSVSGMLKYCLMAIATGCLAGLVGIGGGLIFSPFFLLMGIEPAIAVATSSTCVIFTSSSTSFQYLLTDRIIMSLTVLYGVVNLFASYVGTKFVHWLQDHYATRKSFISGIVLAGVAISLVLCVVKFVQSIKEPLAMSH